MKCSRVWMRPIASKVKGEEGILETKAGRVTMKMDK